MQSRLDIFEQTGLHVVGSEGLVKHREKRRQWIESGLKEAFLEEADRDLSRSKGPHR